MSRLTRCPSCDTLFKVVPDQLRLSHGWVRCGSCGAVFDASIQFETGPEGPPVPAPQTVSQDASGQDIRREPVFENMGYTPNSVDEKTEIDVYPDLNLDSTEVADTAVVVLTEASFAPVDDPDAESLMPMPPVSSASTPAPKGHPTVAAPVPPLQDDPVMAASAAEVDFLISQLNPDMVGDEPHPRLHARPEPNAHDIASHIIRRRTQSAAAPASEPAGEIEGPMPTLVRASAELDLRPLAPTPVPAPSTRAGREPARRGMKKRAVGPKRDAGGEGAASLRASDTSMAADVPSFLRESSQRQLWRRPAWRAGIIGGGVLLVLGLGLRWVHGQRDWIAAAYPSLRPAVNAMCDALGCEIRPLRWIESITIEGSSFNRLPDGRFRLNLSLRNVEQLAIATPSLTLQLTDAHDQVLTQRVLQPRDVNAPAVLAARRDWSGGITVTLEPAIAGRVAGYRLQTFYP